LVCPLLVDALLDDPLLDSPLLDSPLLDSPLLDSPFAAWLPVSFMSLHPPVIASPEADHTPERRCPGGSHRGQAVRSRRPRLAGCDLAQSYFIGMPMAPADLPGWLETWIGRSFRLAGDA
jgi:hypothetical protein